MLPIVILAGGLATRLRPLTEAIPKSLVPINGEPFIDHQLRLLGAGGFTRIILCLGYLGEMVQEWVGSGKRFGLTVEYSWDGPVQLGTAGAIRKALPLLGDAFMTLYGDSYLPCNYKAVEKTFLASGKPGLMTVFRNEGQWDSSNVEFAAGEIVAYNKRSLTPRMRHIDYGLGCFNQSAFTEGPAEPSDLADVFSDLLSRRELAAFQVEERFYEAGSFQGIQTLSEVLRA
jgi:NDP-sugar pyrophosphorylase family protein